MSAPVDFAAALEGMLRRIVREEIAAALSKPATPEHATAERNPLGSARAFLRAARSGAFPTFRAGRAVTARWADVVAYLESRPIQRRPATTEAPAEEPATDDARRRAALRGAGVVLRPPAKDAPRRREGSKGRR